MIPTVNPAVMSAVRPGQVERDQGVGSAGGYTLRVVANQREEIEDKPLLCDTINIVQSSSHYGPSFFPPR